MAKITKRYCEGRKSPYQLFWIEGGVRHSRFFETEEARDDFLRLNGHLDKRSFEALLGIDENTISDISYIESIRGNVSFRDMWEFWAKNHKSRRVLILWDACDDGSDGTIQKLGFFGVAPTVQRANANQAKLEDSAQLAQVIVLVNELREAGFGLGLGCFVFTGSFRETGSSLFLKINDFMNKKS